MLTGRAKAYSSSCFANCRSISSHFVAVHFWGVRCSQRSQKWINPLILLVRGFSKSSMLIRLKSSSIVLVVIRSMSMVICNLFHEKLANNGKITTFTGVPLFDALARKFFNLNRRNLRPMLKILYAACPCLS